MSDETKREGSCLCGAVHMTANHAGNNVGACHCKMCRRWGGGPFMEVSCGSDVTIDGEDFVSIYDSSVWAERGFCSKCGTHLFYRLKESRQHMVPVGLLEDDERLKFESQVFIDAKPDFYEFSNNTEDLTGAELFAKYAPPD